MRLGFDEMGHRQKILRIWGLQSWVEKGTRNIRGDEPGMLLQMQHICLFSA